MAANTKVYIPQGGDTAEVDSGGAINVNSGATVTVKSGATIAVAAGATFTVGGLSATGVVKAGEATLDGTNPTPVTTGLAAISGAVLTLSQSGAPGLDPTTFTYTKSGGTLNIYAWKPTSNSDPTLIASTNAAAVIGWVAIGS